MPTRASVKPTIVAIERTDHLAAGLIGDDNVVYGSLSRSDSFQIRAASRHSVGNPKAQ
jgi:hypothetical protein